MLRDQKGSKLTQNGVQKTEFGMSYSKKYLCWTSFWYFDLLRNWWHCVCVCSGKLGGDTAHDSNFSTSRCKHCLRCQLLKQLTLNFGFIYVDPTFKEFTLRKLHSRQTLTWKDVSTIIRSHQQALVGFSFHESVLDERDSQWQWYMSNESSRSALFRNANIKIVFVQIKIIITILLFCHLSSTKFAHTANLFRV